MWAPEMEVAAMGGGSALEILGDVTGEGEGCPVQAALLITGNALWLQTGN